MKKYLMLGIVPLALFLCGNYKVCSAAMLAKSCMPQISPNTFYVNGLGKNIMDQNNYPLSIRNHLVSEIKMVQKLLNQGQYNGVFEIGAAQADNAPFFLNQEKAYFGIDINPNFVKIAQEKLEKLSQKKQKSKVQICDFYDLSGDFFVKQDLSKYLLFLPFNLFGNFDNKTQALQKLLELKRDFVISFYDITPEAHTARKDYYQACRFKDLEYYETQKFAKFSSTDGLDSVAYQIDHLAQMILEQSKFCKSSITIEKLSFGKFGKAIYVKFGEQL